MAETIGFLLSDLARILRREFDLRARTSGATGAQWRTLKILEHREGINQGQLAEQLEVEPITACRMIDRLEEAGLVERRRDPADRRAWQIFLTAKAYPVLDELHHVAGGLIEDLLQGFKPDDRDRLVDFLTTMRANLTHGNEGNEAANG